MDFLNKERLRVAWLIFWPFIIHNLSEGMAVGTSLVYDLKTGLITTIAIGIQDFPEGIVVFLPLATLQKKRLMPIIMGALSGVVEMIMVILGAFLFTVFHSLLPLRPRNDWGSDALRYDKGEDWRYTRGGNETLVILGFSLGFYVMFFLDSMFRMRSIVVRGEVQISRPVL